MSCLIGQPVTAYVYPAPLELPFAQTFSFGQLPLALVLNRRDFASLCTPEIGDYRVMIGVFYLDDIKISAFNPLAVQDVIYPVRRVLATVRESRTIPRLHEGILQPPAHDAISV